MLNVVSASAGSGKTYRLAKEYLKLLFARKGAYRGILAVTFTNKATEEMKERILSRLFELATAPAKSCYYKDIVEVAKESELFGGVVTDEKVSEVAASLMKEILNDYSAFSVSTIDRFFQRTMRAFARELGIYNSYSVELDRQSVYEEGIDAMIDSLDEDKDGVLLDWLTDMSVSSLADGNNWNIRDELKKFGISVFSEEFRIKSGGVPVDRMLGMERINAVKESCEECIREYREGFRKYGKEAVGAVEAAGLELSDFIRGSRSPFLQLKKVADGDVFELKPSLTGLIGAGPDSWLPKSAKGSVKDIVRGVYDSLNDILDSMNDFQESGLRLFNTALRVRKVISTLGVMSDIASHTSEILRERNMVMLDDTNETLSRIIADDDCPFIYEKLGTRYVNFMLDEFQDTSRLQWSNFRPLVTESLAGGNYCLIVGDVKQSIYRWRSGDWSILQYGLSDDFPQMIVNETLGENWRSSKNIVSFNNGFFEALRGQTSCSQLPLVYSAVYQKIAKEDSDGQGYVSFTFGEKTDEEYGMLAHVKDRIDDVVSRGGRYGDIAVLVRSNAEGTKVVEHLVSCGIPVVSEDSLYLKSSKAVESVVASLRSCASKDYGTSLYALCEELVDALPQEQKEAETPYLYSMLDRVNEYMMQNGSDMSRFLSWWDKSKDKFTIPPPDGNASVQVMTIHKSKGLDFGIVIIPFMEIPLYKDTNVWCRLPDELAGAGGEEMIVPVNLSSSAESTCFKDDYEQEREQACIDNVNVAYVAFTRAVREMHIIAKPFTASFMKSAEDFCAQKPEVWPECKSIAEYLYLYCCAEGYLSQGMEGQVGVPADMSSGKPGCDEKSDTLVVKGFNRCDIGGRLKLSYDSKDYFQEVNPRKRGTMLHAVMSRVTTADTLEASVREAVYAGDISSDDEGKVFGYLEDALEKVAGRGWFDGSYEVINEVAVIAPGEDVSRPDRVMLKGNEAVIVDYKFGEHKKQYETQISDYAGLLSRMGYLDVKAFLWYVDKNEIMRVC